MTTDLHRGAALAVIGALAFACASALIKVAADDLPNVMVVFLRTLFGLLALLPWLLRQHRGSGVELKTHRIGSHLLRVGFGLSAMYCFFYAISQMDLASAVLLNYSQPLFLPFIAWAWLSEKPPARIFPAVAMGFVGVALILKPGLGWFGSTGMIGLAAGVLAATAMTAIRSMADTEPPLRIVFYFCIFSVLFTLIPALLFWQTPSWQNGLAMAGAGAFATLGQLTLTRAYTLAPAAHIGSLVYTTVLFAALLGWIFWQEAPDLLSAAGVVMVVAAAVIVVFVRRPARKRANAE